MSQATDRPDTTSTGQDVPGPRPPAEAPPEMVEHPDMTAEAAPAVAPTGDPLVIGLPAFLVGSVALGLVLIDFAPVAAAGAAIPIILTATSVGLFIAAIWAARLGQNAVATVTGVFAGFWLSFAAVEIGLGHSWWAILPSGVARSTEVFLIAWIVVIGLLTLGSFRLPAAFTALLALVEVALVVLLIATVQASVNLTKTAGWVVLVFAAVGGYLYLSTLSTATGGRPYPMGKPLIS